MRGDGTGRGRETASGAASDDDLSARLRRLDERMGRRSESGPSGSPARRAASPEETSALAKGFRISAEFMAGVIVGGGLGWACDHYLGTKPWGLVVFLMLGFATGVYNVMRVSGFTTGTGPR